MLIRNVRFGRATNSSSMHSVVYNDKFLKLKDIYDGGGYYGRWPAFQLVTKSSKEEYLKAIIATTVRCKIGYGLTDVFNQQFDIDLNEYDIDHQSMFYMPGKFEYKCFNKEFWNDFSSFILRDDIVVVGNGDEMEDDDMIKLDCREIDFINNIMDQGELVASKNGNYWVMFNNDNGDKSRVCFQLGEQLKPIYPELIDIKITDKCESNCSFCYQCSTPDGKCCNVDLLKSTLKYAPDFSEIVLGGGDILTIPEEHAQIINKYSNERQLSATINGETYKTDKRSKVRQLLNKSLKALGVSISSPAGLKNFYKIMKDFPDIKEIVAHVIPDIMTDKDLKLIIKKMHRIDKASRYPDNFHDGAKVLFLGFKPVGRAVNANHEHKDWLIDWINEQDFFLFRLGVDTKFIMDYPEIKQKVDAHFFTEFEGEFSMYIDLVDRFISPSSWDKRHIPLDSFAKPTYSKELEWYAWMFKHIRNL